MPSSWRVFRPVLLVLVILTLTFPLAVSTSTAQDDQPEPIVVQGTPELEALVGAIKNAYTAANPGADVQIATDSGQRGGFEALCSSDADVVMSGGPISDKQLTDCDKQGYVETVLAYEAIVLLPTPEATLTCASSAVLNDAWQLGAPADVTWSDLGSTALQTPVTFYGPQSDSTAYTLFKALVPAGDLREGITAEQDAAGVLAKVQEAGSGAFGFMSLADFERLNAGESAAALQIQDEAGNCITPSANTLADRTYSLARTDYLYVSTASAQRPEVQAFLQFALVDAGGVKALGPDQGFTVADDATYESGVKNVLDGKTGRTFSRPVTPVKVSTAETGTITITGTSMLSYLTTPTTNQFRTRFTGATITVDAAGNTKGWEAFCKGEADVLQTTRAATDAEMTLCEENSIDPYTLDLGAQALVVAVPASNDWIECLDAGTAASLFRAGTEEQPAPAKWSEVDPGWPEKDLLLVAPPLKTGETDYLLFTLLHDLTFPTRLDMVEDDDPLYRAQGVANTDNGLTYLWWTDLQGSTADVRLVAVDAGSGCVAPSAETIADGTYPLSFPVRYAFSQKAFTNGLLRALLWHFFDTTTLDRLEKYPFVGLNLDALRGDQRDAVYDLLTAYEEQAAAQAPAEATPTATPEGTPELTATPEGGS